MNQLYYFALSWNITKIGVSADTSVLLKRLRKGQPERWQKEDEICEDNS